MKRHLPVILFALLTSANATWAASKCVGPCLQLIG